MKRYTDAHYEVVSDPRPVRKRRDGWETALLLAAAAFAVFAAFNRAVDSHNANASPAPVAAPPER